MVDVAAVQAVPMFSELSAKDLKRLAKDFRTRSFPAGANIVTQGEVGGGLFVIDSGTAKVIINGRTRRRLGPGSVFGELSVFIQSERTATVQAETDVTVLAMSSSAFLTAAKEHWPIAKNVMGVLANRLASMNKKL